ncbi:MAG TPA: SRPBCC family protein [Actinoplanes sp.]|nr:SRPBCC family protein [Actinoplanes sp.]
MSTVAVTRLIDAPGAQVWRVFTGLSDRAEWLHTVTSVEVLTSGPFGAGTVWRETRTMPDGEAVTEEFRVAECVIGQRFVVSSPGMGADYRMTYTFVAVTAGRHTGSTMVTVVQDGSPTAPSGRLLAMVFGGLAARTVEGALRHDLDDLAIAATTGPPNGEAAA